jgi:Phosphotransferase enzyme family
MRSVRNTHAKPQILNNIDRDNATKHAALPGPPHRSKDLEKRAEEEIIKRRLGNWYSAEQRVGCPARRRPRPSRFAPVEVGLKAGNAGPDGSKEEITGATAGDNGQADAAIFDDSVIDGAAIVDLATRIRGIECRIFREPHTEGFCWIGFLQFIDQIEWTVRLPKPRLSDSDTTYNAATFRERCATMIVALECVGTRTTLPVPRIHDFDLCSTNVLKRPYILMDCLPGQPLGSVLEGLKDHQIRSIIRQWAEYTMELVTLQFPEIGSLYKKGDGEFFVGALLPRLDSSPAGIGPFKSVADYFLLSSSNKKRSHPKPPPKVYGSILRASLIDSLFPFIILPGFLNGPFVLSHRSLDIDSILVDDDGRLTGILGWQNAAVVPLQSHIRVPDSLNLEFLPPSDTNATPTRIIFAKRYRRHFERAMAETSDNQWDIPDLIDRSLMYGLFEKAVLDAENEKYLPALWDHVFGKEEQAETLRAAMKKGAWGIAMGKRSDSLARG